MSCATANAYNQDINKRLARIGLGNARVSIIYGEANIIYGPTYNIDTILTYA